jgi:hypothetical protein
MLFNFSEIGIIPINLRVSIIMIIIIKNIFVVVCLVLFVFLGIKIIQIIIIIIKHTPPNLWGMHRNTA